MEAIKPQYQSPEELNDTNNQTFYENTDLGEEKRIFPNRR
jgi:hypothetical protein